GRGFAGKTSDIPPGARGSAAGARQSVGAQPTPGTQPVWTRPNYYQKYFNPADPLFEAVFQSDVELDVPLPQQHAKGTPLGGQDPVSLHMAGTGRTSGDVAEG